MGSTTARALVSDYNNYCIQSGLDPAQIVSYAPTITDYGGVATTSVFAEYLAPTAATHVEGIFVPFDCILVAASAKYVHDVAGAAAAATSSLDIDVMASPSAAESIAANYGKLGTAINLTRDEMNGLHWAKSVTGLTIAVSGGSTIAFRSLVNTASIDAAVNADLQLCFWLAVPQSKFGLPTTQS